MKMQNERHRRARRAAAALLLAAALLPAAGTRAEDTARWPRELGTSIREDGKMHMDASEISEGYFIARSSSSTDRRLKLRVVKGDVTLTYDLNGKCENEVFPLQLGSGTYEVSLWENVSGKKYAQAGKVTLNVQLTREDAAFLYPNQYVNYGPVSEAVAAAAEICAGKSDEEAYQAVCEFIASHFAYDYVKAVTVQPGMLPDIDGSYDKRMGVCQDLSAIMVCMLRTQGIPSRLIIGYADKNYHAWTTTTIGGEERFFDPTAAVNAIAVVSDYSVERFY